MFCIVFYLIYLYVNINVFLNFQVLFNVVRYRIIGDDFVIIFFDIDQNFGNVIFKFSVNFDIIFNYKVYVCIINLKKLFISFYIFQNFFYFCYIYMDVNY